MGERCKGSSISIFCHSDNDFRGSPSSVRRDDWWLTETINHVLEIQKCRPEPLCPSLLARGVCCLDKITLGWVVNRRWLLSLRCNDFATIIGCHLNPDAVWHATRPNWSFDQQNSGSTHSKYGFWGFVMSGLLVFNSAAFRVRWSHVTASRWVGGLAARMGFFRGGKI